MTDAGLEHLKGLNALSALSVRSTKLTDAGLQHLKGLTNLQRLTLFDTKATDAGLAHLQGLTNLRSLELSGDKLSEKGVTQLRQALPRCYICFWNPPSLTLPAFPVVGDVLHHLPESHFDLLVEAAQFGHAYKITFNGVAYTLALSDTQSTIYIQTEDRSFRTAEGFSVMNTIGDLLARYPNGRRYDPGWGSYVVLPSGWAAFEHPVDWKAEPGCRIHNFFRRRDTIPVAQVKKGAGEDRP